jgi:hypothetical protein
LGILCIRYKQINWLSLTARCSAEDNALRSADAAALFDQLVLIASERCHVKGTALAHGKRAVTTGLDVASGD